MNKKKTIYSDKNYPLQAGRQYDVTPVDYWIPSYSENVSLMKINRYGQATLSVATDSALVGVQTVVVQADTLVWREA
jgi:hypothetical protein